MAKRTIIIGAQTGQFKDKNSGELVPFVVLHLVKHNCNCAGICTEQLKIYSGSQAYDYVMKYAQGDLTALVNRVVSLDRTDRGYLEDIEFGDKDEDAVIIDL